jgi:signal transduction histidine kinase
MSIRTRLTVWYACVLLVSLVAVSGLTYYEFMVERPATRAAGGPLDPVWEEDLEIALFAGLPCLVLSIVGGWWLARKAFKPLEQLTAAAENVRAGNLKQQLSVPPSRDEIARLTVVFNAMTARLDESFERVRQFTLSASHELKTPLAIIRNELETALNEPGVSTHEQERAASLLDEVERLAHVVDDLTFLTKADSGLITFRQEPVRLDELVREAHSDAQVLASQTEVKANLGRCDAATVIGDRHRLRQLLLILTDNAIKHNEASGKISISVANDGTTVELRVANTGPGLQPDELPRAFDRFFRGQAAQINAAEGTGLGLSIARSIAQAHGADLQMESAPGELTSVMARFKAVATVEPTRTPESTMV